MKKSYKIGESAYLIDNSYSQDLYNGQYPIENKGVGLAGAFGISPVLVKIASDPIIVKSHTILGTTIINEMLIVKYNNKLFLVLNCFTDKIDEVDFDYDYY